MNCPKCNSFVIKRVKRSFLEKLFTSAKKYKCGKCKKLFFKKEKS